MEYRVELTSRAEKDIEDLYKWVIHRAPHQGAIWYTGLIDAIKSLVHHPHRCPLSQEGFELNQPIRNLLYGKRPYRIYFWIKGDEIQILHIRRGARKPWSVEL